MKAFFITRHIPSTRSGGGIATLAFLNSVIDIYDGNVHLYVAEEFDESVLLKSITTIYRQKKRSVLLGILEIFTGRLTRFKEDTIKADIRKHRPDVVFLDGSIISGSFARLIRKLGIQTATLYHNFEIDYHRDSKSVETLKGNFVFWLKKLEALAYKNSDFNLFLSQYDYNLFQKVYGKREDNYILGSFEHRPFSSVDFTKSPNVHNRIKLIISGTLSDLQTEHSIINFINSIYKTSHYPRKKVSLSIAGRNPSGNLYDICRKNNIEIIDSPTDMKNTLHSHDIYVCPINLGGGIKIRIMDALAVGLPCLVHPISARGYEMINRSFFKTYEDAETFSNQLNELITLLSDSNCKTKIREEYNNYFSFEKGVERLKKILAK